MLLTRRQHFRAGWPSHRSNLAYSGDLGDDALLANSAPR